MISEEFGPAEVTRDEFGGYCCKRWGPGGEADEETVCEQLGLDIDALAFQIVM